VSTIGIAKWNGTTWSPLGSGMGGTFPYVYALTVYNNELIAGGQFSTAGGLSTIGIAKWNGTTWSYLGSGGMGHTLYPSVFALTVYNNELIAGGKFTSVSGVNVNHIAKWNGTNWLPLGNGVVGGVTDTFVSALTIYNNEMIAGGAFTTAGGVSANNIAKWGTGIGIKTISSEIPIIFKLGQNFPNPFNPETKIKFSLPSDVKREMSNTKLTVYDLLGREITTLINRQLQPGTYEVSFDGSNITSGIYFYILETADYSSVKRMMLIK
jgi:hypothetical protein